MVNEKGIGFAKWKQLEDKSREILGMYLGLMIIQWMRWYLWLTTWDLIMDNVMNVFEGGEAVGGWMLWFPLRAEHPELSDDHPNETPS